MEEYNEIQETTAAETVSVQEENQPVQEIKPDNQQENFRNLRLAKERAEQRERELEKRLKQLEEEKAAQYDDDDYVPRKYVDKNNLEMKKQLEALTTEYRLRSQYPDFDRVVTETTIARLREQNPGLALALSKLDDNDYAKAAGAYDAIKNMGLYQEDTYAPQREKAKANANSPRPMQSIAPQRGNPASPLEHANAFAEGSPEHLKSLLQEMLAVRRNSN